MTKIDRTRDSASINSSPMPSINAASSNTPPALANGSTAIDGLSGSPNTMLSAAAMPEGGDTGSVKR
jgi:hypothetical protein